MMRKKLFKTSPRTTLHKKTTMLLASFLALTLTTLLLFNDLQFWYYSTKAQKAYEAGNSATALSLYSQLEKNKKFGYLTYQNEAAILYENAQYEAALKKMNKAVKDTCLTETKTSAASSTSWSASEHAKPYCDVIDYNLGNLFYRVGEAIASSTTATTSTATASSEVNEKAKNLWYQAIGSYQNDLNLNKNDVAAQENIDFILKKLNTENKSTSSSPQESNTDKKDSGQQEESKGADSEQPNDTEGDQNAEDKKEGSGSNESGNKGEKKDNENSSSSDKEQDGKTDNTQLTKNASQQVDNYMKQLDQQSQQLQDYFRRNPNAKQPQQPSGLFNDPFFNQFFGVPDSQFNSSNQPQSLDRDW